MGLLSWIGGGDKSKGQQMLGGAGLDLIGGLADSALGAYYDRKAASRANKYALFARSTAHQVEVEDLKKAGLNPVLSALGTGGHGASYNAPSAVRSPNPTPVFSNAAKALTRAEIRKATAEADSAESQAKIDAAEADQRANKLSNELIGIIADNALKGDAQELNKLERFLKKQQLRLGIKDEDLRDIEVAFRQAEKEFFWGNPFLHGFKMMGGSAQQLGKLSDYTQQLLDAVQWFTKFRDAQDKWKSDYKLRQDKLNQKPSNYEQIRKFGKGFEQLIRRYK